MPAAPTGQTVRLDAAAAGRHFPVPFDPAVLLQPMKRGKERSRLHLKRAFRRLEDALGDGGAVERLQFERAKDQQIQRALDERGDGIGHG